MAVKRARDLPYKRSDVYEWVREWFDWPESKRNAIPLEKHIKQKLGSLADPDLETNDETVKVWNHLKKDLSTYAPRS